MDFYEIAEQRVIGGIATAGAVAVLASLLAYFTGASVPAAKPCRCPWKVEPYGDPTRSMVTTTDDPAVNDSLI